MNVDLPAGAHVRIIIMPAGSGGMLPEPLSVPPVPALSRPRRRLLKGAAVLVMAGFAYVMGQHSHPAGRAVQPAQTSNAQTSNAQTDQPPSMPERTAEIPPAFRQQLRTPPRVTPPPGGAAPSVKPGEDGFGLEN